MDSAQSHFNEVIAGEQIDCSGGMKDACAAIQQHQACYAAAQDLALNHVSVAGIPARLPDGSTVAEVTGSWLATAESTFIATSGEVLKFGASILGVVGLYAELNSAYGQCS
jgi:hypothetical protein